jgi:hypothetical protein
MAENFFHYPDDTIFVGLADNPNGFSFLQSRALTNDNDKLEKLKARIVGYYVNGLNEMQHPFTVAILTCVGIEVLGQIILGFNTKGETIANNTISVYQMLDPKMKEPTSDLFKINYNLNRNEIGQNIDFVKDLPTYSHIIRKGLRNAFTHNYRSLGVLLDDGQQDVIVVDENKGTLIINPFVFRTKFLDCFHTRFTEILSNTHLEYRQNALKYFDLLIK